MAQKMKPFENIEINYRTLLGNTVFIEGTEMPYIPQVHRIKSPILVPNMQRRETFVYGEDYQGINFSQLFSPNAIYH